MTFATAISYGVGSYPISACTADFDGDGKPDLAVANSGSNSISILRNTSTGGCCRGMTGNTDGSCGDVVDISDIMTVVDYLVHSIPMSPCFTENDVNTDGTVDISDIFRLIDYLVDSVPLPACP